MKSSFSLLPKSCIFLKEVLQATEAKNATLVDINLRHESNIFTANSFKSHMQSHKSNTDFTNFDINVKLDKHKFKISIQKYTKVIYLYSSPPHLSAILISKVSVTRSQLWS